jgi:hypothetical protein
VAGSKKRTRNKKEQGTKKNKEQGNKRTRSKKEQGTRE